MAALREIRGTGASPGIARGPAFLAKPAAGPATTGETAGGSEVAALENAVTRAAMDLRTLAAATDADSAALLDFQIEVLEDPTITERVAQRLAAGESAAFAWIGVLDPYVAELEAAEDEQIRARAIDVIDIKSRVLGVLAGEVFADFPKGAVFIGHDIEPSRFLAHDWSQGGGIALFAGSAASHVAMLARSRSVPMVVASGPFAIADGEDVLADGGTGTIRLGPADIDGAQTPATSSHFSPAGRSAERMRGDEGGDLSANAEQETPSSGAARHLLPAGAKGEQAGGFDDHGFVSNEAQTPAATSLFSPAGRSAERMRGDEGGDLSTNAEQEAPSSRAASHLLPAGAKGEQAGITLSINLNTIQEIAALPPTGIAGIGLMRSEFAFSSLAEIADEERQLAVYRHVLDWAAGRPVTIRMLDLGGDKPLRGLASEACTSPHLRGIRLLLSRPELARVQARALLRAAPFGDLRVLLPMVTYPDELEAMQAILGEEAASLASRRIPHRLAPVGIMVEVPAAALMLDAFGAAAFFSIGTNDLAQYLSAASRDDAAAASYYKRATPAILRLAQQTADLAAAMGKPLAVCGDLAAEPENLPGLLAAGIRHFSVAPPALAGLRSALIGRNADETTAAGV
ncbi:PEP-utilizing enzyme [Rhizobium sp. LjRoot30]|uniref:putative PEP-binding protein n=1 Tax=Rhizobium sp. LjRoot30 TaxID=3342320 RepID=UPI003ECF2BF6